MGGTHKITANPGNARLLPMSMGAQLPSARSEEFRVQKGLEEGNRTDLCSAEACIRDAFDTAHGGLAAIFCSARQTWFARHITVRATVASRQLQ